MASVDELNPTVDGDDTDVVEDGDVRQHNHNTATYISVCGVRHCFCVGGSQSVVRLDLTAEVDAASSRGGIP